MIGVVTALAAVLCLLLSWSIGANDVANSFGTSVGAKALTVNSAIVIAAIFEFAGAELLGANVAGTFKNGIIDISVYEDTPYVLLLGMTSAIVGAFILLFAATALALPVSGTHAVVGAVVGFSLVADGFGSVRWEGVIRMVSSWLISPMVAGTFSLVLYVVSRWAILRRLDSYLRALVLFPPLTGLVVTINLFFILYKGAPLGIDISFVSWWIVLVGSIVVGILTCLIAAAAVPLLKKRIRTRVDKMNEAEAEKEAAHEKRDKLSDIEGKEMSERGNGDEAAEPEGAHDVEEAAEDNEKKCLAQEGDESMESNRESCAVNLQVVVEGHTTAEVVQDVRDEKDEKDEQDVKNAENVENVEKRESFDVSVHAQGEGEAQGRAKEWSDGSKAHGAASFTSAPEIVSERKVSEGEVKEEENKNKEAEEREQDQSDVKTITSVIETFNQPTEEVFGYLQVLMACFGSFAHGANDIANTIGPFAVVWEIYKNGAVDDDAPVQWWIILGGSIAVVVGLATWGYRVMRTIGQDLAQVHFLSMHCLFVVYFFSVILVLSDNLCQTIPCESSLRTFFFLLLLYPS
eukprot:TRINITY_DN3273_c0_g1_i2.p1 TRINITY_DN3273_c0_g1~~TRINITY_DN3273_c0_g1_i2.p1  ORF type:complete len:575 (-),score=143.52 TRINITY_DN3273_c0_g1_i2:38-1762(-)